MVLRDFVLHNFRWKATALLLAMLVWFVIRFAIYRGITGEGRQQVLRRCPVMVLKAPEDPRVFQIHPPDVDVVVRSTKNLRVEDLQIFVNLITMPEVDTAFKDVLVRGPNGTKVITVLPPLAAVERVSPLDSPLTNSFPQR